MATGIVSIAAADHGFDGISDVLAVIAVALFAALVVAALVRLRPDFDDLDVPCNCSRSLRRARSWARG